MTIMVMTICCDFGDNNYCDDDDVVGGGVGGDCGNCDVNKISLIKFR